MRNNSTIFLGLTCSLALLAAGCGRTNMYSGQADNGVQLQPDSRPMLPDTWTPPPDGLVLPDTWTPPPPPPDSGLPPPPDQWLPPVDAVIPPPPDTWTPPPDGPIPPPPDSGIPTPDVGPCTATCSQMCKVLINCGLYKDSLARCTSDCTGWSGQQTTCLEKLICSSISSCLAYATCLPTTRKPDLVVDTLTAKVSGSTVTYDIKFCNRGQAAATGFYVDIYYNRSAAPKVKEYGNQYVQYSKFLAAGACDSTSFTRSSTPPGTYASWAQVDSDDYVAESSETNNSKGPVNVVVSGTPPPRQPDLTVRRMTASVYGIGSLNAVRFSINVCNDGAVSSPSSRVDVYYNPARPPVAGQSGDASTSVPGLSAGSCTTRTLVRLGVPSGSYASYAQVDPTNAVAESSETNNVYGPVKYSVNVSTPGADLHIARFTYQAYALNTVLYTVRVCNKGTGSSASTRVDVFYNRSTAPKQGNTGDGSTTVPGLAAGACSNTYVTRLGTPSGNYTSWAYVDTKNTVKETDENNNGAGPLKVSVGGTSNRADLYFKSFDAKVVGNEFEYSMQVCNKGKTSAALFRVDLYYNRTSAPKVNQNGDANSYVPLLNAGACRSLTLYRKNPPSGTYNSYAQADTTGWITESDENNNVAGPKTVTMGSSSGCTAICLFSVSCGLFTLSEWQQCTAWCKSMDSKTKSCAQAALAKSSCSDLKKCSLPPKPPPPPPLWVCPTVCNWLSRTCNLIPSNLVLLCMANCQSLPNAKISCMQKAYQSSQCLQAITCML
jgi:subtilase family serine protease